MAPLTRDQAQLLTALVSSLRTDWDQAGVFAALRSAAGRGSAWEVTHAALYAAEDRANRTPAVIALTGNHWTRGHAIGHTTSYRDERCTVPSHEHCPASACPLCRSEQLERPADAVDLDHLPRVRPERLAELAAQARAAIGGGVVVGLGAATRAAVEAEGDDVRKRAAGDHS